MKAHLLSISLACAFACSPAIADDEFKALGEASGKPLAAIQMAKVEGGYVLPTIRPIVNINQNVVVNPTVNQTVGYAPGGHIYQTSHIGVRVNLNAR